MPKISPSPSSFSTQVDAASESTVGRGTLGRRDSFRLLFAGSLGMALALSTPACSGEDLLETSPEDLRLRRYKAHYERWAEVHYERWKNVVKTPCSWDEIRDRFLMNDARFLKLAEAMEEGGILFSVDREGNPLVADGGVEPIMRGMSYGATRKAVMMTTDAEGRELLTGYEMFHHIDTPPYSSYFDEIPDFERFTGDLFVRSLDRSEFRGSFLESGGDPDRIRMKIFSPRCNCIEDGDIAPGYLDWPGLPDPNIGVRRLLRLTRAAF